MQFLRPEGFIRKFCFLYGTKINFVRTFVDKVLSKLAELHSICPAICKRWEIVLRTFCWNEYDKFFETAFYYFLGTFLNKFVRKKIMFPGHEEKILEVWREIYRSDCADKKLEEYVSEKTLHIFLFTRSWKLDWNHCKAFRNSRQKAFSLTREYFRKTRFPFREKHFCKVVFETEAKVVRNFGYKSADMVVETAF